MSSSASLTAGVAGRYATALFELALDQGSLDRVERDLDALEAALAASADLRGMIVSPMFGRDEMGAAVAAIARRMDLGREVASTLGLMAQNRRLFVLRGLIAAVKARIAAERGEVSADVASARPLSDDQRARLRETLRAQVGKEVELNEKIDESLIGGLVVKVGSRMIDTSIRAKLANLQNVMKEVG